MMVRVRPHRLRWVIYPAMAALFSGYVFCVVVFSIAVITADNNIGCVQFPGETTVVCR